ncbi:MAG: hypothetical protein Q7S29_02290 [Candidatus Peribacter sp.]|nr:hypothetical protein [Candidatus Peribacter sp.]
MLRWIDKFLNGITMYRLTLYVLAAFFLVAVLFAAFGVLSMSPLMLLFSLLFITVLCWATNTFFSLSFGAPTNVESVYITAFILVLLISPPASVGDGQYLELACWASIWAMASKYIIAIRRKHLFNPAAFAVALTALTLNQSASWWVATSAMAPFIFVGGLLMTRKIQRFDLVVSFFVVALLAILLPHLADTPSLGRLTRNVLANTPLLFFAFIMLTEPLTLPPQRLLRVVYGALTGLLFAPWIHLGSFTFTPELALVAGNVFSYLVSPKQKLFLTLKQKIPMAQDIYEFVFSSDRLLRFMPGQYLEWTLGHARPDTRGNRRYFTISSSPAESDIAVGVRFYPQSSTFKQNLLAMEPGGTIIASQLAGEFILPKDTTKKLVFMAGGIGITPFRSMVQDLLDRSEARSVTLLYSNRTASEIAYREVFAEAEKRLRLKVIYTLTDQKAVPTGWQGAVGRIDEQMIRREVPDFADRYFFISGTRAMVLAFADTLQRMGVSPSRIRQDFFPGFV